MEGEVYSLYFFAPVFVHLCGFDNHLLPLKIMFLQSLYYRVESTHFLLFYFAVRDINNTSNINSGPKKCLQKVMKCVCDILPLTTLILFGLCIKQIYKAL